MSSRFRIPDRMRAMSALAASALALGACDRHESASVPQAAPDRPSVQGTAVPTIFPGGGKPPAPDPEGAKYDGNPQAIAEGKRLFGWYNCSGCHFNGAGGIGPSLMDDNWIYGDSMDQIYATIYQGRPNGMPSWGGKLSTTEIWEIAAFVRSAAKDAKGVAIPTEPPPATPVGSARTVDAPQPAVTDVPPMTPATDKQP